jgi:Enolase C-terminal domain-like
VGARPERPATAAFSRRVVCDGIELFVDSNGAYSRKQALRMGHRLADTADTSRLEEPVSSDDLTGLRIVQDALDCDVAAGEYGCNATYFDRMVDAGAVDCLQIDVTRCGGYTTWPRAAAVAGAQGLEISVHWRPQSARPRGRERAASAPHRVPPHRHALLRRCVRSPAWAASPGPRSAGPRHGTLKESAAPHRR